MSNYRTFGYFDGRNQIFAVAYNRTVIAEFRDINAPNYNASNERDKFLSSLEGCKPADAGVIPQSDDLPQFDTDIADRESIHC